ncbi:hypothetical protein SAY86_015558 [Trapa natans]|uniref:Lipase n=1 Tax=Trapa natans TaxID=22666 RepID=A0AAN7QYM2_TRANT|nr:hypothetical protein SAY86_015558 [Trapa natans]
MVGCQSILATGRPWVVQLAVAVVAAILGANESSMHRVTVFPSPESQGVCATSVTIHGYKCEEFDVVTQDGYILRIQRLPMGRMGIGSRGNRQPVIIQHGVLVDGMTWLLNSPEQNLPMILSDNGFDVWITNTRGTRFSRRHQFLDPSQPKFWDWSWDELVMYDLPAVFNFVYDRSGNRKIHYVGHSMGTLMVLASLSEGRLVDKLKSVALLSPIAYLSHMTTALGVVAAKSFVGEATTLFGIGEFNPKGEPVGQFLKLLCAQPGVDCYDLLTALTGNNCCLNSTTVDLFLQNEPQPTSTKNMVHLAQTVRDRRLTKYNYGIPVFNLLIYGDLAPPPYDLSNIPKDMPMFVSYGGRDALSDPRDVQALLDSLKLHDVDKLSVQFVEDYAHADYIMGVNAKDVVYSQVLSFFTKIPS